MSDNAQYTDELSTDIEITYILFHGDAKAESDKSGCGDSEVT